MGKIAFIDEMPDADKDYILSHRQEILDLATELGIVNVRVGYTGRLVGTITDGAALLANYAFTAAASDHLTSAATYRPISLGNRSSADCRVSAPIT